MHDFKLELGQKVEPAGLLMAEGPLLLEALQARVIRVQLERPIEVIRAEGMGAVHHSQELEQVRRNGLPCPGLSPGQGRPGRAAGNRSKIDKLCNG